LVEGLFFENGRVKEPRRSEAMILLDRAGFLEHAHDFRLAGVFRDKQG
jgi:hypothetical protein